LPAVDEKKERGEKETTRGMRGNGKEIATWEILSGPW